LYNQHWGRPANSPTLGLFPTTVPGKAGGCRQSGPAGTLPAIRNPQFGCSRSPAISRHELGMVSALPSRNIVVCDRCFQPGYCKFSKRQELCLAQRRRDAEDDRGSTLPFSAPPRLRASRFWLQPPPLAAALIAIDASRHAYAVQKSKIWQNFFVAGPAQPGRHGRTPPARPRNSRNSCSLRRPDLLGRGRPAVGARHARGRRATGDLPLWANSMVAWEDALTCGVTARLLRRLPARLSCYWQKPKISGVRGTEPLAVVLAPKLRIQEPGEPKSAAPDQSHPGFMAGE
jgi:hypothetical protein